MKPDPAAHIAAELRRVGGWHIDDDAHDQRNVSTGRPTFTNEEADAVELALDELHAAGRNPWSEPAILAAYEDVR